MTLFTYLSKSENSVAILLTIAVLSMAYPYGFPLFGLSALFFVVLKLLHKKVKIRINIGFLLFFLCAISYFIGLTLSQGLIYSNNISDITNIIGFFLVWILLSDLEKDDYPIMIHKFAKLAVFTAFIISVIGLYKFYMLLNGVQISSFLVGGTYYPPGTSLVRDYNMFSFSITAGLVMCLYLINQAKKMTHILYYFASFSCMFGAVLFTGSRRGWIVALILIIFIIISLVKFFAHLKRNFSKLIKVGFVASFIFLFGFMVSMLFDFEVNFNLEESNQIQRIQSRIESLQFSQNDNNFSERTERWKYSGELFNQSNVAEFFIGSGFDYLPKYANKFNTATQEDYPHNPFLSAILYSGVVGLIVLIGLLLWTFFNAINNIKLLGIYYILLFFLSLIFILVSGNSIFSITLFMLFVLLIISIPRNNNSPAPSAN